MRYPNWTVLGLKRIDSRTVQITLPKKHGDMICKWFDNLKKDRKVRMKIDLEPRDITAKQHAYYRGYIVPLCVDTMNFEPQQDKGKTIRSAKKVAHLALKDYFGKKDSIGEPISMSYYSVEDYQKYILRICEYLTVNYGIIVTEMEDK